MPELQQKVETRLKNLIVNKDQELADLIYDLGYEYENESYTSLFSDWTENQRSLVDQITRLGYHGDFSIFWVRLNNKRLNKANQRNIINLINRRFPYNLCIFSNLDDTIWDFINIKAVKDEPSDDDKEPKKRQYLRRIRIDKQDYLHTAVERISLLKVPHADIHHFEIQKQHDEAFDVEKLNKDFYSKIALSFTQLVGGKRKVGSRTEEFEALLKLPSTTDHQKMQEFAVRLIGRLVFCWFLKNKESENKHPLIHEEVLSTGAVRSNYYHDVLEPLFFEVLNTPIDSRLEQYQSNDWENIPFLNGGLFEPNSEDYYEINEVTHESKYLNTLVIPDDWFSELFEIFEGYNFTIDENTSIDIDLSIDPEILGRIFENLLAEINPETGRTARKNTGSYYTPRPIVEYMVDESLKQYLLTNTEIEEEKITELLDYSGEEDTFTEIEKKIIISALDEIKIIDPACGSGAFPMGILQKMLLILQKIDPESVEWLIKQLDRIPDANVRKEVEEKLVNENWNYIHKLGIIQNSIYGMDIQPIASEISKLRFFLSLIVDGKVDDSKPNRGLKPLPNLEFKFVCANSLIGLPESESDADQVGMFNDTFFDDFSQAVNDYFNASNPDEKHSVRERIEALIDGKTNEKFETIQALNKLITVDPRRLREREQETARLTQLMTLWGSYKNLFKNEPVGFFDIQYFFPECKDGFDVVIANPPYVRPHKISQDIKELLWENYRPIFQAKSDLYACFIKKSIDLLKQKSIMCFIVSKTWISLESFKELRKYILNNTCVRLISIPPKKTFQQASVETVIVVFEKNQKESDRKNNEIIITEFNGSIFQFDKKIPQRLFYQTHLETFDLSLDDFTVSLNEKIMGNSIPLSECVEFYYGIKTGDDSKFIHTDPLTDQHKKLLRRRDFSKYCTHWAGEYVWYVPDEMRSHKNTARPGTSERFESEKIIIQDIGKSLVATLDTKAYYIKDALILLCKQNFYSLKFILGIINSKLLNYYYRKTFITLSVAKNAFLSLPIHSIVNSQSETKENCESIIINVEKVIKIKNEDNKSDTSELESRIDNLVYNIYGITDEEIEIIEGSI